MLWYILFGGAALAAVLAFMRGQNPLIWFFTSVPGVLLLPMLPPPKSGRLGETNRARRQVGDKVGMVVGGGVLALALVLKIIGI